MIVKLLRVAPYLLSMISYGWLELVSMTKINYESSNLVCQEHNFGPKGLH